MIMDYLVVDMGNFLTKWGICSVYEDGQRCWRVTESIPTRKSSELLSSWEKVSLRYRPDYVSISNVSSMNLDVVVPLFEEYWGLPVNHIISASDYRGLRSLYKNPRQLGSDRWASAVAAYTLFPAEFVVVLNCGTALTADVVGDSLYWGGTIAPGFYWLEKSLLEGTTLTLEDIDFSELPHMLNDFPQDTTTAVKLGSCDLAIGWAQRMVERASNKFKMTPRIIISGGSGEFLYRLWNKSFSIPAHYIDTLVLDGLVYITQHKTG